MKYRIKEEGGWFYPQARPTWIWKDMRAWNGVCFDYRFREIGQARQVIDNDAAERQRIAMVKANTKYHSYP